MTRSWCIVGLLALALAGCCKEAHTGPKPVLSPPTEYRNYAHWECPSGYHTEDDDEFFNGRVTWCELDSERDRRIENYELSMHPQGNQ